MEESDEAQDQGAGADLPFEKINGYIAPEFASDLEGSLELKALELTNVGAAFFKKLQCKLNACLWDIHAALSHTDGLFVNVSAIGSSKNKQMSICMNIPMDKKVQMPCISRLVPGNSKGSIFCTKIFGVS